MKVLHFVSIPSRGSGIMSVIMNYYRHIDRDKVQFDFLCFLKCEDSHEEEIKRLGGSITYIPKPGSSLASIKVLKSFLKNHGKEYTWFHNHEVYLSFFLEPLAKRYGISHFIVHSHATRYSDKTLSAARNRLLCLPIKFMKCERFACSEAAGRFLYGTHMMEDGHVFILHNAIDCERYRFDPEKRKQLREKMGLDGKFVIGHVGRFERQKNHEFLINVFAECRQKNQDCVLLLIGEGSLFSKVEKQVQRENLEDSVFFLKQRDDVADLLQVMDAFVLPSLFEGVGVVLLEAQASGLCCVASDCVPQEATAGGVTFLPLSYPVTAWAKSILDNVDKKTKVMDDIRDKLSVQFKSELMISGKSIIEAGACLENKYLEGMKT